MLLVEWMTPPYRYVYRFTTTPLANQALVEEMRLVRFVEAAAPSIRTSCSRGFPAPRRPPPATPRSARCPWPSGGGAGRRRTGCAEHVWRW